MIYFAKYSISFFSPIKIKELLSKFSIIETFDFSVEGFIRAKIIYASLKYTLWIDLLDKFDLPLYIKDILKKYDFTYNWKFKDINESNFVKILEK